MEVGMADTKRLYYNYRDEHDIAISKVVQSGRYIGGEELDLFSKELSDYLGSDENIVIPCANGSDALMIAYMSVGLQAGDEVIMPSHNYISSLESAIRLSLVPIFADTDIRDEYRFSINTNRDYLDTLISEKTKAIVMVNMYGMPCDVLALKEYCRDRNLILIEDNAQGMGGSVFIDGYERKMSTLGDISITSFFPTKPLGCMGDGGAIITKNKKWADTARVIAQHGQIEKYNYKLVGVNSRLDNIQAAILRIRLRRLYDIISSYNKSADIYRKELSDLPIILPKIPDGATATFYQYTILLDCDVDREYIRKFLIGKGISSQLYYPELLHNIESYKVYYNDIASSSFYNSTIISNRMLSLPIFPFMEDDEIYYVCNNLKEAIGINN